MQTDNNNTTETTTKKLGGAFAALKPKDNGDKAHVVYADSQVTEDSLILSLSLEAMSNAKPSKSGKGATGFMLQPISFTVDGQTFSINPGWVTLSAR